MTILQKVAGAALPPGVEQKLDQSVASMDVVKGELAVTNGLLRDILQELRDRP
jgi:hypothetical protein